MKTVFEAVEPRAEVLAGELREEMFAARLEDVVHGVADPIYQDPARFFGNTHPSGGLRNLLAEAFGRASDGGPASAPNIRLETAFGGGKTHSLIALYHLAAGARPEGVERYVRPDLLPQEPIPVAAVVGTAMEPGQGIDHGEVTTWTVWGELAYQLGRYEAVRKDDEARTAPGTQTLAKVLGDGPVIVLMDELARYLAVAGGHRVGNKTLADQTTAFLVALLEAAGSASRAVVVYTLASSSDAFAAETEEIQQVLHGSRAVSAKFEHVITPTAEDEIAAIVRHRLFERVDPTAAQETARAYHEALVAELDRGADRAGARGHARRVRPAQPRLHDPEGRADGGDGMTQRSEFELVVVPVGDADLGIELWQVSNGRSSEPRTVVSVAGRSLQAAGDHVLDALRAAGHRPSDLRRTRTKPFHLPEPVGVRLGLALLATKPLRKIRRIEEISSAVRTMSDDEAYYWFAKCTDPDHGLRAQRAFRDLWSDR